MDQGIEMGIAEIRKHHGPGRLSQMMVLTDGETSGEPTCRQLAKQAAAEKIRFNVIGVGTDWNQNLIKDLAKLAEGDWGYIDVNDASAAERRLRRGVRQPGRRPASSTSRCTSRR